MSVAAQIESRLNAGLAPTVLSIRDDSAQHAGHAGAREGGHFHVAVVSDRFAGLPRLARHRLVYHCLSDLMQRGIHALTIDARTPGESESGQA